MTGLIYAMIGAGLVVLAQIALGRFASFRAQKPEDYAGEGLAFDLREHLSGPLQCEGVIYGPFGRVTSRFVADMNVVWDGNIGRMSERFYYDSGAVQDRNWTLTLGEDGQIKAEAPDVIGTGRGRQMGGAVLLEYRMQLGQDAGGHALDAVDWMYLAPNGAILNRSQFRKFGFKVAELVATMRPKPSETAEIAAQ